MLDLIRAHLDKGYKVHNKIIKAGRIELKVVGCDYSVFYKGNNMYNAMTEYERSELQGIYKLYTASYIVNQDLRQEMINDLS